MSGRGYRFVAEIRTSAAASNGEVPWDGAGTAEALQPVPSQNLPIPFASSSGRRTNLEELSEVPADVVDLTHPGTFSRRRARPLARRLFAGGLVLLVAAALAWLFYPRSPTSQKIGSIAVLPLENFSNDTSQDYFADGMTDELITDLGQISALRVISRTSIMTYKRVRKLLPDIARELNVDAVVEGTVLRSGERVGLPSSSSRFPLKGKYGPRVLKVICATRSPSRLVSLTPLPSRSMRQ